MTRPSPPARSAPPRLARAALLALLAAAAPAVARDRYAAPAELIRQAAAAPEQGAPGLVRFRVRAVGRAQDRVYLNSEADYRDPRNLTVVVSGPAVSALEAHYGRAETFKGREVIVNGVVRRVRIDFAENTKPTDLYYFQFHLPVTNPGRLWVTSRGETPPSELTAPLPATPDGA